MDGDLGSRHTDLLFAAPFIAGDEGFVYLLFEHQSHSDPLMAWRLLRYMVRIWESWLRANPEAKTLPVIYPIVLAQGGDSWSAPRSFGDLLDWPMHGTHRMRKAVPDFTYHIEHIDQIPDEDLQGAALGRMALLLMKHAWAGDIWQQLERWIATFKEIADAPDGIEALRLLLRYMIHVGEERDPPTRARIKAIIERELGPTATEEYMTFAQALREEGRAEGRAEGKAEGEAEGRQKLAAVLARLLEKRFGALSEDARRRIDEAGLEDLGRWSLRVLDVDELAEVFVDG